MLWVALELPSLPLQIAERAGASRQPLVISEGTTQRPLVACANTAARDVGIREGQAVAAAKALAGDLRVIERDPAAEREALERLAAWAGQFTPMACIDGQGIALEVESSLKLFDGHAKLTAAIRRGVHDLGFNATLGVAPTVLAARVFARAEAQGRAMRSCDAVQDLSERLAELPVFLLEWPATETAQPEVIPGELASGEWIPAAAAYQRFVHAEVLAAPPILHILRVLAEDGPHRGLPRLLVPAEADWGPMRKIELRDGIAMLPVRTRTLPPAATTNAYLLGRGEAVLVDPGSDLPEEIDRLEAALEAARERDGRRVKEIWLTHHHPDHVAGAAEMQRRLGVPIAAHRLTAERLGKRLRIARDLKAEQRIDLAGKTPEDAMTFRVLHTPGHARGHLCFFEEAQGSLICGDLVAGIGTIVIDPPEGEMTEYLASLGQMIALAPRTLFPAHGPAIEDASAKLSEYIAHRLRREEKVLSAWADGLHSAARMVERVYDDAPQAARLLAERQIEAHLVRLRALGRI